MGRRYTDGAGSAAVRREQAERGREDGVVRSSVEETLNALLDAEGDQI
jgi:hypothetical protein